MKIDIDVEKDNWHLQVHGNRGILSTPDWSLEVGKLEEIQRWVLYRNDAPEWVQSLLWAVGKILNEEEVVE